jgi:fatty-acyl-CoA synthase
MFIYIGEMCRYLMQVEPGPADRGHKVRLCVGNGLRPDVWVPFRERFGIRRIREFYASTEGNCSLFNHDSRPESVGRVPRWASFRFPIRVIRFDVATDEVVRGPNGLCIECASDELGETIGQILADPARPGNRFEGYSDRVATEAKILRDVFVKGDAWFRTGDLMRRDKRGYFFFVDRIGDTFRWKGENVATSQVAETLTAFPGVVEACVYGVAVPGTEGRAGMACLVVEDRRAFDLVGLRAFLDRRLPAYAVPIFLRFADQLVLTGTFKQRKIELVNQGFDPARSPDPIFMRDTKNPGYTPVDAAAFAAIGAGRVRL